MMRLRTSFVWVAAFSALMLSACQPKQAPRPGPPRVTRPPAGAAVSARDYVARAASIDLFEVKSSALARSRTASAATRDFASAMIAGHNGTAAQLSFAGRRLNLLPSAALLPAHQRMLDELAASANVDATYRRQQLEVHRAAVKLHSDFARGGASPTLRPVAASAARIERAHLDRLRVL